MILRRRDSDRVVRGALVAAAAVAVAAMGAALGGGCAQIAGLSDHQLYPIIQLTAGVDHACALMRTGAVWCWGANATGQLGHRTSDGGDCTSDCPPQAVEGISGVTQVSAGAGFTCAVGMDGRVQCWGRNVKNELGRSTPTSCQGGVICDPVPAPVSGISGAAQVSAGGAYACAVTTGGAVSCWGDNTYAQIGTPGFMAAPTATPVMGLPKAVGVSADLIGATTCAALGDGSVSCWGLNAVGGVGHTPGTGIDVMAKDGQPCSPSPTPVAGVHGALTVLTANNAGCAGLGSSGFSCWGNDAFDALGTPTTGAMGINLPPAAVTVVPGLTALALRNTTSCGIDAEGAAWCWGESGVGALGPETGMAETCNTHLCQRQAQNVGLGSVTQIAAGSNLTVALTADGAVWAWGFNDSGQLGHPIGKDGDGPCPANTFALCNHTPNQVQGLP